MVAPYMKLLMAGQRILSRKWSFAFFADIRPRAGILSIWVSYGALCELDGVLRLRSCLYIKISQQSQVQRARSSAYPQMLPFREDLVTIPTFHVATATPQRLRLFDYRRHRVCTLSDGTYLEFEGRRCRPRPRIMLRSTCVHVLPGRGSITSCIFLQSLLLPQPCPFARICLKHPILRISETSP